MSSVADYCTVYSGKPGFCTCGCSGTYYQRGDKMFYTMLNKVFDNVNTVVNSEGDLTVKIGNRFYVASVKKLSNIDRL